MQKQERKTRICQQLGVFSKGLRENRHPIKALNGIARCQCL